MAERTQAKNRGQVGGARSAIYPRRRKTDTPRHDHRLVPTLCAAQSIAGYFYSQPAAYQRHINDSLRRAAPDDLRAARTR